CVVVLDEKAYFFQAEAGIRDLHVTGVQTCALPISSAASTAISYCPAAASAPASAARNRARTLPMSNAAQLMVGLTDQASLRPATSEENSPDRKPAKPRMLIRGNRSAVATPTRAVAEARRRSAARTSG